MKTIDSDFRLQRFLEKTIVPKEKNGCVMWVGAKVTNNKGLSYGQFWDGDKRILAHRWAYQYFNGKLEKRRTIDHQCNNSLCVNPLHLKQMSLRENILRSIKSPSAINARKKVCNKGHRFDKTNSYGFRICLTCRRIGNKKWVKK